MLHKPWNPVRDGGYLNCAAKSFCFLFPLPLPSLLIRGIFWACELITGTRTSSDLLLSKYILASLNISHFSFSSYKSSHTGCSCIHPPLQLAPSQLPSPNHSPPIPEILHLYSTAVWLTQPILLHCNLEEDTPFLLLLCSLRGLEDYQDSFTVLLEFARSSHSHCVPEFTQPVDNGEKENCRISVT